MYKNSKLILFLLSNYQKIFVTCTIRQMKKNCALVFLLFIILTSAFATNIEIEVGPVYRSTKLFGKEIDLYAQSSQSFKKGVLKEEVFICPKDYSLSLSYSEFNNENYFYVRTSFQGSVNLYQAITEEVGFSYGLKFGKTSYVEARISLGVYVQVANVDKNFLISYCPNLNVSLSGVWKDKVKASVSFVSNSQFFYTRQETYSIQASLAYKINDSFNIKSTFNRVMNDFPMEREKINEIFVSFILGWRIK